MLYEDGGTRNPDTTSTRTEAPQPSDTVRGLVAAHVLLGQFRLELDKGTIYQSDARSLIAVKEQAWQALQQSTGVLAEDKPDEIIREGEDLSTVSQMAL